MQKIKKKVSYFTKVHEDAILEYVATDSLERREELYVEYIKPVFNELVDKIVYTYKFTSLSNINDLKEECKSWLITILDKFDDSKGSKAFSYFSVIVKNWFIHRVKKQSQLMRRELQFDNMPRVIEEEYLSVENPYIETRENKEFFDALWGEIDSWDKVPMKENERKVYEAVKILLSSPEDIEIFNKKAIYLYLREITGLNTKQVVTNLNKIRTKYKRFKGTWEK